MAMPMCTTCLSRQHVCYVCLLVINRARNYTTMPRRVKRRTEEYSQIYTPFAGSSDQAKAASTNNGDEITPYVIKDVDTTKRNSGDDCMMSALKRFAADIGIGGSSHNITRDELMDLVHAKVDKIEAEQSRKAAREAMEIEKQVSAKKNGRATPL